MEMLSPNTLFRKDQLPPYTNGRSGALLAAFEAGYALFRSVIIDAEILLARSGLHGTHLVAGPALDAVRRPFRKNGRETVENRQARAQRADNLAEEPPMSHDQDDQCKEYRQPNGKSHHICGAVDYRPGDSGFYCGHRAKTAKI